MVSINIVYIATAKPTSDPRDYTTPKELLLAMQRFRASVNDAIEELQGKTQGGRPLLCLALCKGSGKPCMKQCKYGSENMVDDARPPYSASKSFEVLSLLLCRQHWPDEDYWAPLFLDLMGIALLLEEDSPTMQRNLVALLKISDSELYFALQQLIAWYIDNCGQTYLKTVPMTPQRHESRAKAQRNTPSTPLSTPRHNVESPMSSHGSIQSPERQGQPINLAMDFFPAIFTLLLEEDFRCIYHYSTYHRCQTYVESSLRNNTRNEIKQDLGRPLSSQALQRLVRYMLCDHHCTGKWMIAYIRKWTHHCADSVPETLLPMAADRATDKEIRYEPRTLSLPLRGRTSELCNAETSNPTYEETEEGAEAESSSGIEDMTDLFQSPDGTARRHRKSPKGRPSPSSLDRGRDARHTPYLRDLSPEFVLFDKCNAADSESRNLIKDLQDIGHCKGIVPRTVKQLAKELLEKRRLQNVNFSNVQDLYAYGGDGGRQSQRDFWYRVCELHEAALECHENQECEASWNAEVHSTVLRLAFQGERRKETGVWYRNITRARFLKESLSSLTGHLPDKKDKMVDYAIVIDPTEALKYRIMTKLQQEEWSSINYVESKSLRYSPMVISIETKRAGGDENKAVDQLSSCVSAHFARLRQLMGESNRETSEYQMPALPLVFVCGHDWTFMLAEAKTGTRRRVRILHAIDMGTTKSILGIYQLMVSLRRLGSWVNEVYRPWFEEVALGIRSDEPASS